jgi:hypothetical protein
MPIRPSLRRSRLFLLGGLTLCLVTILLAPQLSGQSMSDVKGTWSGDWIPESGPRDRVTVEFRVEDGSLIGKLLNPAQLDLSRADFDEKTHVVMAEAVDPETHAHFTIEATVEGTRMNGKMDSTEGSGEIRLTKWTYVPRPR